MRSYWTKDKQNSKKRPCAHLNVCHPRSKTVHSRATDFSSFRNVLGVTKVQTVTHLGFLLYWGLLVRNSVLDSPLLVEASSETRHFVPLRLKTVHSVSVIILPCGKAKSCHLKMWSSDVTIPSLILIVYGSGPDLLSMVAFTRTLSPSRNGCADPFHVAPSVAMIGLPCSPLCLVKWDPAEFVGDS